MMKISIVYHSGQGHTKAIAQSVARGAEDKGGVVVKLMEYNKTDAAFLNDSDAIILGCPTYMGSVSAELKMFMDSTSDAWSQQKWRNKIAAGFTNSSAYSGDKLNTLMQMVLFACQHGMIWVGLDLMAGNSSSKGSNGDLNRIGSWVGLMAQSNTDQNAELAPPVSDRKTAEYFGRRIVEVTQKFKSRE
jgi:multimeric flavodoxin WrbA